MIIISQSIPLSPRLYPTLNLVGYSLCLWGILWELPEHTLGYTLGAARAYPGVYSGSCQSIPWGILWELPEHTLGYTLGAPRAYPGVYSGSCQSIPWGILWELPEHTLGYSLGAPVLYLGIVQSGGGGINCAVTLVIDLCWASVADDRPSLIQQ